MLDRPDVHVRCVDCASVYAVKRITDAVESPLNHCIFCGSNNIKTGPEDGDYWMLLAQDLGLPNAPHSAELIKLIFDAWNPAAGDATRFVDYARTVIDPQ